MKHLYILFTLLFCSQSFKSQNYYVQDFDGANTTPSTSIMVTIQTSSTNIWQIGKPQKTLFSSASTTPNVIVTDTINNYPSKNVSSFTFPVVNTYWPSVTWAIWAVRWKQKLDMDQGLDGGIIEYSTNSGNTWLNAMNTPTVYNFYGYQPANKDTLPSGEFCFSGTDNVWRDIWLCFSNSVTAANDTLLLRFTFKSDSVNTNKEGWMIDNMMAYMTNIHPVKQASQAEYINVYPNITNGIVNVEAKKYREDDVILKMELLNAEGKIIESYGQNKMKVVLDISKHPPGLYHLNITTNVKSASQTILLEKN
jgi:hypothetical protein